VACEPAGGRDPRVRDGEKWSDRLVLIAEEHELIG
jgi:hypothetical protein